MLDNYVAGVREFSDEKLFAVHQNNLKLRADDLIEITRAELARRVYPPIEGREIGWYRHSRGDYPIHSMSDLSASFFLEGRAVIPVKLTSLFFVAGKNASELWSFS
jgi:hypothetical protein